ncbi:fasciclin domain-containing protein [Pontibacter sp. CAU 1760]
MKKRTIIPMALASTLFMFSCASSNENMTDATAMDETTTMSETQTMAGSTTDADAATMQALVIEREIVAPLATVTMATLPLTNTVEISDMFDDIDNTEQYSIMDLARKSPNLTTFVKLIEQANLVEDINRLNEATLFAPTNEAFAKIDRSKLEMLVMPENQAKLMQVIQAHVLPSKVSSMQFNTSQRIQVSENRYIPISSTLNGTNVMIGNANIVQNNIEGSNGFIHVVDAVIMPDQVAVEQGAGY